MHPLIQDVTHDLLSERQDSLYKTGVSEEPARSASRHDRSTKTGIHHGFLNRSVQPKKGILKNAETQKQVVHPERVSRPRVSQALVAKQGPSAAEESAFSGCVTERLGHASSSRNDHQVRHSLVMVGSDVLEPTV